MAESSTQAGGDAAKDVGTGVAQSALFDAGEAPLAERVARGYVPVYQDIVLTPEQVVEAQQRWPDETENQQRHYMRKSILAKLRHSVVLDPSTGRRAFGGAQPGSGRKRELGNSLVDTAERRQDEIMNAIFSALDDKLPPEVRHKAGINIVREVRKDREADMREDALDTAAKEDLVSEAAKILAAMVRSGEIDLSDPDAIIDAQVVEG